MAAPTNSGRSLLIATQIFIEARRRSRSLLREKKVVWHVLDSYLEFAKGKTEWNDTNVVFEITKKEDGKTELRFTHAGLVPAFECYDDCSNAWGFYINSNLKKFITKGEGQPNKKEK